MVTSTYKFDKPSDSEVAPSDLPDGTPAAPTVPNKESPLGSLFSAMVSGGDTALDVAVGLVKLLHAKGVISADEANAVLKPCVKHQERMTEFIEVLRAEGSLPAEKTVEMAAELAALTNLTEPVRV